MDAGLVEASALLGAAPQKQRAAALAVIGAIARERSAVLPV